MSEEAELTAAFEELETGSAETPVEATEIAETDLAEELEDELKHMSVSADDSEEDEGPDEKKEKEQCDDCVLEVRLRQQFIANVLLIERCD
jgi:hypothetical protein